MSTIVFYGGCEACDNVNVHYCLTNPDNEADYKFYCMKCIPNGTYKIEKLNLCYGCEQFDDDSLNEGVFAKVDDSTYCFNDFLREYKLKRLNFSII